MSDAFVLPVDKVEGPTSHDIVVAARRALGIRRVGHTGTLDPFASGLLLLCVGRATRVAEYLTGLEKQYEATARLGVETDTLDRDGVIVSEKAWAGVSEADVVSALRALEGDVDQVPPQFSAKKVDGVAMHRRARRGESVELPAARVTVYAIEPMGFDPPDVHFSVRCSSGTYVRSLARDLGRALGVGSHLIALRRTAIGTFDVEQAISVEEINDPTALSAARIDPLTALAHLPAVEVDDDAAGRLGHGQRLRLQDGPRPGLVTVTVGGELLAIGEVDDGVLRPKKVLGT